MPPGLKQVLKNAGTQYLQRMRSADRIALSPDHWELEYADDRLCYRGMPLADLLSAVRTPSHIVLESLLLKNLRDFQANDCDVFLSYKTNPVPGLLQLLHQRGAGAEVVCEFELWLALQLGVSAERIIYNGSAKSDRSLEQAVAAGVLAVHVNHSEEIRRLRSAAQRVGKQVRVGLRIAGSGWGGQFGFSIANGAALAALRELLAIPEFIVTSLHCHRGVPIHTAGDITQHVREVLSFCDQAAAATGWAPVCLDLGGSLAIPTVRPLSARDIKLGWAFCLPPEAPDPTATLRPRDFALQISEQVRAHFSAVNRTAPRLIVEPGRALSGNAQFLLTQVVDVRREEAFDYAVLDASACHARIMTDEFHQILPLKRTSKQGLYRVVGPVCHTGDVISRGYRGCEIQTGDRLALMDSGAYCIADAAQFSSPRPGVSLIRDDLSVTELRPTETFEDLVHLDSLDDGTHPFRSQLPVAKVGH